MLIVIACICVCFAVGRLGVHSPCRVLPKDFKKWYPQLPCLALGIYGRLWRTSRQVRLLCPWARHLKGRLRLYVEDRWPRHLGNGNSQASADFPSKIQQYNSLTREWKINMNNTIQYNTICFRFVLHFADPCLVSNCTWVDIIAWLLALRECRMRCFAVVVGFFILLDWMLRISNSVCLNTRAHETKYTFE